MKKIVTRLFCAFASVSLLSVSMLISNVQAEDTKAFKLVHIPEVTEALKVVPPAMHIFDANNSETREKFGTIPGATLLDSYRSYDLKVLPVDKNAKLVFYCANPNCTASHTAAERASAAGYKDVSVFSDGIQGWVKAGLKADALPASHKG